MVDFTTMGPMQRMKSTPVPVQRTTRTLQHRVLTSLPAGKMVPLLAVPLLREDSVAGGAYRISFEMNETVEILMNAVNVRVMAYLVPRMAFDRFDGMDSINKSYEGIPMVTGNPATIIPWFQEMTALAPGDMPILDYLGAHYREDTEINTDYIEAYNAIWNFRAKNRSQDITLRSSTALDLAPAFWQHQAWAHVVPDFDQAVIDGEVALNIIPLAPGTGKVFVSGLGSTSNTNAGSLGSVNDADGSTATYAIRRETSAGGTQIRFRDKGAGVLAPDVYADVTAVFSEMVEQGVTVSLSNIEMARKTQAFANLRRQYSGHSDEYIIDLLMDGISIPEESWKHPILLADESTVFGMSKRYASDSGNLTESVVNGATMIDLRFSVPRVNMGGVIMIVAEIAPEQLFERQKDPYLHALAVDNLPQFLRDTLDPEKVVIVKNEEVDIDHDTPTDTFGYAPLNHEWAKSRPTIGGKFKRPTVDAPFDEDRQRIWAVETANPVLSQDFYLVTQMHYKPFVVTDLAIDPFEALMRGVTSIRGNTVFGGLLVEATGDYAAVAAEAPTERIDKE